MAKYERVFVGDFDSALGRLTNEILSGSVSASLEGGSDYREGYFRCALRVFERFSMIGGNRLSCSVMMVGNGSNIRVTVVTSGGSQAVFFKINTLGEDAFLSKIRSVIDEL